MCSCSPLGTRFYSRSVEGVIDADFGLLYLTGGSVGEGDVDLVVVDDCGGGAGDDFFVFHRASQYSTKAYSYSIKDSCDEYIVIFQELCSLCRF